MNVNAQNMLKKIADSQKAGNAHIRILYPGLVMENSTDSGLGAIGRIDHAIIPGDTTIKMHPHANDEILSYFRTGYAIHTDSEGFTAKIDRHKLILMKAGNLFYHEETMPGPLEGLQIFIRPQTKDRTPEVVFHDLKEAESINQWRLLASPFGTTPLQFSSQVWIYDTSLLQAHTMELPDAGKDRLTGLLYVFQGTIVVNDDIVLEKGSSVICRDEPVLIRALQPSELVLFMTDETAPCYDQGMFSGNRRGDVSK